jgi:hypothetical protein
VSTYKSSDCAFLLLGPYDLTGVSNKLEEDSSLPVSNTTPFGVSASRYEQPGVAEYAINGHGGWYDDSTTSINAAMVDLAAGSNVFMFAHAGNTAGQPVICAAGTLKTEYKRGPTVGDFTTAEMSLAVSGAKHNALIVAPFTARTTAADTSGTYLDLGAPVAATITANSVANPTIVTTSAPHGFVSGQTVTCGGTNSTPALTGPYTLSVIDATHFSVPVNVTVAGTAGTATVTPGAAGGHAYMSCPVLTLGGYTNLIVSVQDSTDHITFADDTAFTALTAAGAEYKATSALSRYICVKWLWTGTGSNQTATFAVAVRPNP